MKNRGLIVRYGQVAILSALAAALALGSSACGPPRAEEYEFEEDDCGNLTRPRDPSPAPDARGALIRGVAERVDDDTVSITLAPLVSVEANAVVDWTADGVTVRGNASATAELACELELVADVAEAKPVDIVFVLDTTGSMFWAIDGVKAGIEAFLATLEGFNIDARVGGVEFGDENRTTVPLGELDGFREWLDNMTAVGGGDSPESPLDAIEIANTFSYRPEALRYMITITDTGVHESTDATDCSETTLQATQAALDPSTFLAVVHLNLGEPPGVHPRELTRALGGLYVALGSSNAVNFNISSDTPTDDVLGGIAVLTCTGAADSDEVEIETTVDDEPVTTTLAING
jgi:Mg-chelatase subunit ChlD